MPSSSLRSAEWVSAENLHTLSEEQSRNGVDRKPNHLRFIENNL
jgi:hypothetical protein